MSAAANIRIEAINTPQAFEEFAQLGGKIAFTDSFELARRQVSEYQWIETEWRT